MIDYPEFADYTDGSGVDLEKMSKLVGSHVENLRSFEPDNPSARNPWDPTRHPDQYIYIQTIINRIDREEVKQPKYTEETRQEIYRLRDAGYTLREISEKVKASKSTLCLYLQNRHKYQVAKVNQPGTTRVVETSCNVNEVDIGKIPVIAPKLQNNG